MEQILGVDKPTIDKHFKKFRREFNKVPGVIDSLNNEVTDRNGHPLNVNDISQDIEKFKTHFQELSPQFIAIFYLHIFSWVKLFTGEIKLQIEFTKLSYSEYKKEKRKESINTKKIFLLIHHFSVHIANVCKLFDKLTTPNVKGSILAPFFDDIDFDTTSMKVLRNHLEHFEERLDAWSYLHIGKPVLDMNIINSSTKGINVEDCLRVLDSEQDIIYILGEKFRLKELYKIAGKIESRILELEKWANNSVEGTRRSLAAYRANL